MLEKKIITPEQIEVLGCECCKYKHNTHIFCQQELCCILADGDKNMLTVDDERYIIDGNKGKENKQMAEKQDMVNHPKHYNDCSIECIDIMVMMFGAEYVAMHCVITAYKYMHRYKSKNGFEDLKKAEWYLTKHAELCGEYELRFYNNYNEMCNMLEKMLGEYEDGK